MKTRDWLMTEESLLEKNVDSFEDLSAEEKKNLEMVMTELKGWATQNVDMVLSVMAEDGVYYDITGEPAAGHDEIREFGIGWIDAVPDFKPFIEAFVVQGNKVVNMGRIRGTIQKGIFRSAGHRKIIRLSILPGGLYRKRERSNTFETIGISWTCITRSAGTLPL